MKINLKRLFGKEILKRGNNYYEERRVSNLLKNGNTITASVQGTHHYKISINLETNTFRCNCPYEGRMCKHLAAVCYAINNTKNVQKVENIEANLAKKSKEELVRIMQEMLIQEPKLARLLLTKEQQILRQIKEIDLQDEEEGWAEFYDYIPDRVEEIIEEIDLVSNKQKLLLALLKETQKLNEKYDNHGSTEDVIFYVLEKIEEENKNLPKNEAQQLDDHIKHILGKDYESFTQIEEGEDE